MPQNSHRKAEKEDERFQDGGAIERRKTMELLLAMLWAVLKVMLAMIGCGLALGVLIIILAAVLMIARELFRKK